MSVRAGLHRIIQPASKLWKHWPVTTNTTKYTNVITTPLCVRACLSCQLSTQAKSQEVQNQTADKESTLPESLPPPSKEFLDSLNDSQMKHYKDVVNMYERHWRFQDIKVPAVLTDTRWKKLLGSGKSKTGKILTLMYVKEVKKQHRKENKEHKERKEDVIHKVSLPSERSRKTFTILKAYNAMEYGPELVYDLGFTSNALPFHVFREEARIKKQLQDTIHANAKGRFPFHLVFCNVNESYRSMLEEISGDIPITITERGYLDMFDRRRLVYLSPDSKEDLETFDHNDVYIVGCITDLETKPLTKEKAQRHGIRHTKFPIRKYLGNTTTCLLTLNQVCDVLYDLKDTGDWRTALRHVPVRFQKREKNSISS